MQMKKIYIKPIVQIERFTISQSVAQNCGYNDDVFTGFPTQADKNSCGWNDGYGEVYWTSNVTCGGEYSEDLEVGEVCYNNPNGAPTVFASM